jgi:hypothetical protein
MSLCVLTAGKVAVIAASSFTLSWTHSVEKVEWRENYHVTPAGLQLEEAAIKGSGAGMEPGPDAALENGWWVWQPKIGPLPRLTLAASGATASGWRLCHAGGCLTLGEKTGDEVVVEPCG